MPYVIQNINVYSGTATLTVGTETEIVSITPSGNPISIIEGFIDVSQMSSGTELDIYEYISQDGTTFLKFTAAKLLTPPQAPLIHFYSKAVPGGGGYKVTALQNGGTGITVSYYFVEYVLALS
ncbi:MAG: hypothetical protein ABGW50_01645 [Thermococcus sp.]